MTSNYIAPVEKLAGETVYPADWNRFVDNQQDFHARLTTLEAAAPPDPDFSSFPIGGIIAFYKPVAQIPAGWFLCDGTNSTPDLRSAFIYGASIDDDIGDTGGAATHTHTNPDTNTNGGHSHTASGNTSTGAYTSAASGSTPVASSGHTHSISLTTTSKGDHKHTVGATAAGSTLPPYVKLYWIMRAS